jgi:hypothetical protein
MVEVPRIPYPDAVIGTQHSSLESLIFLLKALSRICIVQIRIRNFQNYLVRDHNPGILVLC